MRKMKKPSLKRKSLAKPPKTSNVKFRIVSTVKMGPYPSIAVVNTIKDRIKKAVSGSKVGANQKTSKGIFFNVTVSDTQTYPSNVNRTAIINHIKSKHPGAKVTITRV